MTRRRFVTYERDGAVGVITLDRPARANAYDRQMLAELAECWLDAEHDDGARVAVVRANGRHFCSGHDTEEVVSASSPPGPDADAYWRWRNVPKPTIAAVQGRCISGGLLLAWTCDLIVASDDAAFSDVLVRYGMGGVLYRGHAWELGARRAKELLFTAEPIDAASALMLGMVNRVVPRSELDDRVMTLARAIAAMDPTALAEAKSGVNRALDAQGQGQVLSEFRRLFETYEELPPQPSRRDRGA
jgi:enoyl-CoA hydratase